MFALSIQTFISHKNIVIRRNKDSAVLLINETEIPLLQIDEMNLRANYCNDKFCAIAEEILCKAMMPIMMYEYNKIDLPDQYFDGKYYYEFSYCEDELVLQLENYYDFCLIASTSNPGLYLENKLLVSDERLGELAQNNHPRIRNCMLKLYRKIALPLIENTEF